MTERTEIERLCQRYADELERQQTKRARMVLQLRAALRWIFWINLTMGAGAGAYCFWTLITKLVTP